MQYVSMWCGHIVDPVAQLGNWNECVNYIQEISLLTSVWLKKCKQNSLNQDN